MVDLIRSRQERASLIIRDILPILARSVPPDMEKNVPLVMVIDALPDSVAIPIEEIENRLMEPRAPQEVDTEEKRETDRWQKKKNSKMRS